MAVFFTADLHFGHANIIKYCKRPFLTVDDMNEALVHNWNCMVQPQDEVYILGDLAFLPPGKANGFISQLKGHKFLVPGNHDSNTRIKEYSNTDTLKGLSVLPNLYERFFKIEDKKVYVVMCHYAMRVWNKSHHGAIHLYGHSHGSLAEDAASLSCDVGVDVWNFAPVSLEEILAKMSTKTFTPIDHHT